MFKVARLTWLIFWISFLTSVGLNANAQEIDNKIETDRPDQTEAASVVPAGALQLESGYEYERDRQEHERITTHAFPTTTARIGLIEGVELRLTAGLRDSVIRKENKRIVRGIGPLNIGAKIKLWSGAGWRPDAAFIANVTLPVGHKGLAPQKPEPLLRLLFENKLTEKLTFSYNLVYSRSQQKSVPGYTASASYDFTDKFTFFAELFGEKEAGQAAQHQYDAGVLFYVLPNVLLDVAVARALTPDAPDIYITSGVSFRLFR